MNQTRVVVSLLGMCMVSHAFVWASCYGMDVDWGWNCFLCLGQFGYVESKIVFVLYNGNSEYYFQVQFSF